jgi:hypothetical protein
LNLAPLYLGCIWHRFISVVRQLNLDCISVACSLFGPNAGVATGSWQTLA